MSDKTSDSRHEVSQQRLDDAIDVVAREMTDLEPRAALRALVLERIEQARTRTGLIVPRRAWAGVAAVAVLAVVTGLWLTRTLPQPNAPQSSVAATRTAAPGAVGAASPRKPVQPAAGPGTMSASPAAHPGPGTRARQLPASRGTQATRETAAGAVTEAAALVPALADIEPLRFSNVGPDALDVPGVVVAPLDVVPTLEIPGLNPGSTDTQSADPKKEK